MKTRTTPKWIKDIEDKQVFVFGSNLKGKHGAGAARMALKWGADFGVSQGFSGATYAIPTKDFKLNTLSIGEIKPFVDTFITEAMVYPEWTFLVTEIGCGLAGLTPGEVAPIFKDAVTVENIHLPESFWKILKA